MPSLPTVLYCCETMSLTLREEENVNMFENNMLRKIFVPVRWSERAAQEIT
jgi:hypothetical protein